MNARNPIAFQFGRFIVSPEPAQADIFCGFWFRKGSGLDRTPFESGSNRGQGQTTEPLSKTHIDCIGYDAL